MKNRRKKTIDENDDSISILMTIKKISFENILYKMI